MTKVTMYSTGLCPFCQRAEQILLRKGVTDLNKILVDVDVSEREAMIARTGRRTVPQIFIGDLHVGGFDDLAELDRKGCLTLMLTR